MNVHHLKHLLSVHLVKGCIKRMIPLEVVFLTAEDFVQAPLPFSLSQVKLSVRYLLLGWNELLYWLFKIL